MAPLYATPMRTRPDVCHTLWVQDTRGEEPRPRTSGVGRVHPKKITGKGSMEPKLGIALPGAVPSCLGGSGLILLIQTYNIIMILTCFFFSPPYLK